MFAAEQDERTAGGENWVDLDPFSSHYGWYFVIRDFVEDLFFCVVAASSFIA